MVVIKKVRTVALAVYVPAGIYLILAAALARVATRAALAIVATRAAPQDSLP